MPEIKANMTYSIDLASQMVNAITKQKVISLVRWESAVDSCVLMQHSTTEVLNSNSIFHKVFDGTRAISRNIPNSVYVFQRKTVGHQEFP